eukprot:scaffold456_cov368-Pavlova_lutheri.AAC.32
MGHVRWEVQRHIQAVLQSSFQHGVCGVLANIHGNDPLHRLTALWWAKRFVHVLVLVDTSGGANGLA